MAHASATTSRASGRGRPGPTARRLWVVLCCCLVAVALRPAAAAGRLPDKELARLEGTTEWRRLLMLWHAMLDHSDRVVYSPEGFRALAEDVEEAEQDLATLAKAKLLRADVAGHLSRLLQSRYSYLVIQQYPTESYASLSPLEAATSASQWIIEMELCLLRRAANGVETEERVIRAARSNLTFELAFLYHCQQFEEEAERHRRELRAAESGGTSVDWQSFDNDYQRRLSRLLEAYRRKDLPRARPVEMMVPYLLALTEATPPKAAPESGSPVR